MATINAQNNFDAVAGSYDNLAKAVFGNKIKQAQKQYLEIIRPGDQVLILGGGTGWILNEIFKLQTEIKITYLDKSSRMIEKAKESITFEESIRVDFEQTAFENWENEITYDVVICNFFLDLFSKEKIEKTILPKIKNCISESGKLIVSDFRISNRGLDSIWQEYLVRSMILFFKMTSRLESSHLAQFDELIQRNEFNISQSTLFYKGMIFTAHYGLDH